MPQSFLKTLNSNPATRKVLKNSDLFTFLLLTSCCIAVAEISHYSNNLAVDIGIDSQTNDYFVEQFY